MLNHENRHAPKLTHTLWASTYFRLPIFWGRQREEKESINREVESFFFTSTSIYSVRSLKKLGKNKQRFLFGKIWGGVGV